MSDIQAASSPSPNPATELAASQPTEGGPLRVLLACDHLDHGDALHGVGRYVIEILHALGERDDVIPFACVLRKESAVGRRLLAEGLPISFFEDGRFDLRTVGRFVSEIRRHDIDVLHLTDFGACTFGRVAGRLTNTPAIVHVHSHHSEYQPRGYPWYVQIAYRMLSPWTDAALAVSPTVRDFSIDRMGFAEDMVDVLPNPLPTHSFRKPTPVETAAVRTRHGIEPDAPLIGCVTRFHAAKGNEYLIRAFALILGRLPDAMLLLIGGGPDEGALRDLARELDVEDRVVFAGFRQDVQAYYSAFDVATLPSIEEGFGLVALEAMALRVPVVASDVGGIPEIIEDGVSGLLVPPADPRSLADALLAVLQDPSLAERIASRGFDRSRGFSVQEHAQGLAARYARIAQRGRAAA